MKIQYFQESCKLDEREELIGILHKGIKWAQVEERLKLKLAKLRSLYEMERTGGQRRANILLLLG